MKRIVRAVYEKYQTYDPFTLAAKMGAFVTEDDLQGIYAYFAHIDNFKIICLNAGLPHYQKAFVLAHCLYHVYRGGQRSRYTDTETGYNQRMKETGTYLHKYF